MPLYYVCALPNKKGAGAPREFFSNDPAKIEQWARQHDKPGWGVYDCPNPLKDGATARNKESIAAVVSVRVDIDSKSVVEPVDAIDACLGEMLLPPATVIDSGHGRHADWALKEPVDTSDKDLIARIDKVRDRLIEILCGDPAPSHHAALFRRPGTHNTKHNEWIECTVLRNSGATVDVTELEELVALHDRPLLTARKEGSIDDADFTFTADKAPIDVDARLAGMRYQGPGDSGINITWWECMGSLLRHETSVADAIERLHEAAAVTCQDDPNKDKWYRTLAGMAERWLRHEPEFLVRLDSRLYDKWMKAVVAGEQPRLVWRRDTGLQVRGYEQNAASGAPTSNPKTDDGPSENKKSAPRFKLLRYRDLRPGINDQDYLIDELLPAEGIVMVWGKFKCLKTFLLYDMMLHIAKGWEYRDRATRQGLAIYCAFEGAHGFPKRTEAQRRYYKLADDDDVPLRVMACPTNLIKDHPRLIADIREQLAPDEKPAAVVLDTLNRSLIGSESKDADMAAYIFAATAIREAFKCLVIVIHHCGWDETRPRGHSSLPGAVDGQLAIVRDGDAVTLLVEFLRDGPEGAEIHSAVKVIEVGQDVTGKMLTSLVVVAANRPAQSSIRTWPKSLLVLRRALKTMLASHGEDFQENILTLPVRAVALEHVRAEFYAIYPAKGDTPEQRQNSKRQAFLRSLERAQELDLIRLREPVEGAPTMIWLPAAGTTQERRG